MLAKPIKSNFMCPFMPALPSMPDVVHIDAGQAAPKLSLQFQACPGEICALYLDDRDTCALRALGEALIPAKEPEVPQEGKKGESDAGS